MSRNEANSPSTVAVLLPLPLAGAYDYAVPAGLDLAPGDVVRVPLGKRSEIGIVWGPGKGDVAPTKLRAVAARLPAPPMTGELRRLIDFVARYAIAPPGSVLKMALPVPEALEAAKPKSGFRRADTAPKRLTPERGRVLGALAGGRVLGLAALVEAARVTEAVVRGLVAAGALESVAMEPDEPAGPSPDPDRDGPALTPDQATAATDLVAKVRARGFAPLLLDGVTGAGKTEVYFEAVAEALRLGRQVLVLVPEIALTAQWLERFVARFGAPPESWHSDLGRAERRRVFRAVAAGRAGVVVGARSALFLPFRDLGLIVVDEEHDGSFKQEDGVMYHARDMAVARAKEAGVPVVLASATPSLETLANVAAGRYGSLHLPGRYGVAELPRIEAIDLRRDPPPTAREFLSLPLRVALGETIAAGEQALLYLNRRGYAPLTLCRHCGYRFKCESCSAWLVDHRLAGRLQCHHCGHVAPRPVKCPECEAEGTLAACGPGVERVAEEVAALFPGTPSAVIASDTMTSPSRIAEAVRAVEAREIRILIGTQMLAKGHHFPFLTLVGVVDADLGLEGGDLRAGERTYQLLAQVAGRAGRAERKGRVLLQTTDPTNPVLAALIAGDRAGFIAREMAGREAAGMPPFGRLAALIVSAPSESQAASAARSLAAAAPRHEGVAVFGPAPAPLALLRGRYRQRFLLKTTRDKSVQSLIRGWLSAVKLSSGTRVKIDIDPVSFM